MQVVSDKTLNCPFCIHPVSDIGYEEHLHSCRRKDARLIQSRLHTQETLSYALLEAYKEYVVYCRDFFPPLWDDHQLTNTEFYAVDINSTEGRRVASLVKHTVNLSRIERVQNKELHMRYTEFKENNTGNELMLFHGSAENIYNLICNQGFDAGHSNLGAHGFGIYLSSTMSYSLGYSRRAGGSGTSMLLCHAFLTADCVISDNIHVVHDDFAVYPSYVLYW